MSEQMDDDAFVDQGSDAIELQQYVLSIEFQTITTFTDGARVSDRGRDTPNRANGRGETVKTRGREWRVTDLP